MADEPQCRQADGGRHTADLPIAPFDQVDLEPMRGDLRAKPDGWISRPEPVRLLDHGRADGTCGPIAQVHSGQELLDCVRSHRALDLGPIALLEVRARIADTPLEGAVIGQKHQPFTVIVETARGIYADNLDVVSERRTAFTVSESTEDAERFVE